MHGTSRSARRRPALALAFDPDSATRVFAPSELERLTLSAEVLTPHPLIRLDTDAAREVLARTEVLLTAWGAPRIDGEVLRAAPHLKLIAHAAGTVKQFVLPEVFEAGIAVTNAVTANAVPVAEYTLAAILFANKRVLEFRDIYRSQRSSVSRHALVGSTLGNFSKTVGIIGASRIGRRVLELLRPFDFAVLLHDPYVDAIEACALGATLCSLDHLLAASDVVSLHAPSLDSTRHMLDARRLGLMRDGTTFINTARGALVDHAALERELVSGRLSAVIDVTEPEVLPADSPLYDLPNVLLTPHIAGAIGNERHRLGSLAIDEIERYARGEPLHHAVEYELLERLA